jgi:hypothetical protein
LNAAIAASRRGSAMPRVPVLGSLEAGIHQSQETGGGICDRFLKRSEIILQENLF